MLHAYARARNNIMKYFVATDIHGSYYWAKKIVEKFNASGADKLVLLGDLYYHGPRNPLPEEYAPMKTAELFNGISDKIIAIRGNCDAEIDETISKFSFSPFYTVDCNGKKVTFTHGHRLNKDNLPEKGTCDILIYGHFHVNEITRNDGVLCVNVASASLPKNGAKPAFCTVADDGLKLETFDDEILGFVKFG